MTPSRRTSRARLGAATSPAPTSFSADACSYTVTRQAGPMQERGGGQAADAGTDDRDARLSRRRHCAP